jgi:outer membrane protein assembly factor BamB
LLVTTVALGPARVSAQANGAWDQYQGDGSHAGSAEGPEPPYRVRWTLPAPEGDALGPAVLDGTRVYTLGREAVYAVDVATGEIAWQVPRDGRVLSSPALMAGSAPTLLFVDGPSGQDADAAASPSLIASGGTGSPTASASPAGTASPSGGTAAGSTAASTLVALDATSGDELWRVPLPGMSRTGVTLDGASAYVGDTKGEVVAIDATDGTIAWTQDIGGRIEVPLAADDASVVVVGEDTDGREVTVAVLDATTGDTRFEPLAFRIGSSAATAPSILDGHAIVGMPDRLVHAFDVEDGTEAWTALTITVFSPATGVAATADDVYVADLSGGLYALDAASGERDWDFQFNELVVRSAPVRVGDSVLLGLTDGRLVAVDAGTGHLTWQGHAPGLTGTLAVGPDVVVAAKGGRDAGLVAYETDPDGALIDVASPTELDAGTTLVRAGVGAAIALAIVLVPGFLLRRRYGGPAFASDAIDPDGLDALDDVDDDEDER